MTLDPTLINNINKADSAFENELSRNYSGGCQFDILAKTDNNIKINIEMQYRNDKCISDRIIYYSDLLSLNKADSASENKFNRNHSVNEYKSGDFYGTKKVISIWIFAENLTEREEPISEIFPCFKENKEDKWEVFTENKRIILFELQKYKVDNENFRDILSGWVNFLQKPEYLENNPLKLKNKELDKAIEKLGIMSKNNQERYYIQSIEDYERDKASEKYWERVEMREKGLKEGKEEGLKEGLDKGLKEKSIEIAKNMLKEGLDINLISKLSGLSVDEIKNIEK